MTTISITKNRIMKAIRNEPTKLLRSGSWCAFDNTKQTVKADCPVCAVGAVMRSVLLDTQSVSFISRAASAATREDDIAPSESLTKNELIQKSFSLVKKQAYMAALSYYFEGLCSIYEANHGLYDSDEIPNHQMANIKRSVIAFVDKNFPYKIQINIDGAKPAQDVKVL